MKEIFSIESKCTAFELRLFIDSAAKRIAKSPLQAPSYPNLSRRLRQFEKYVYGEKNPRWKFTLDRAVILDMLLRASHPRASSKDLLVLLIMCSFSSAVAKKIQIDLDELKFKLTEGLNSKILTILDSAAEDLKG